MRYKVQTTVTIRVLFGKLGTKSNFLVNHKDHPCTILKEIRMSKITHPDHHLHQGKHPHHR
ncbi:hypothetical protein HanPSC8_Chr10g0411551 [Helianthus annuus]|nr:hypothetical protein HanPSC8_Chr10g0411551 [Helianthus annuus]